MVAVQAVAGSIINKAIRVLHQKMTKVVKMEWEDALAAFGKLSDIPETALHINRGEMKLSAIPKPALYIKRGEMEKDLALCTKKRERRVIAMALYGSDPKYVEGCLENARLVEAYFPSWTLRVYADVSSVPPHKLKELEALNVEIHRDDWSAQGTSWGMFRRFFVADDTNVDRFIVRDSDSRLNPRDAFAVADWVDSAYAVHTLRDHPNHQRLLNGGMWGTTRHSNIAGKIETLARQYWDHDAYGADLEFLAADVAPLVAREVLAHDSYSCELFGGSRPFPTRRPRRAPAHRQPPPAHHPRPRR